MALLCLAFMVAGTAATLMLTTCRASSRGNGLLAVIAIFSMVAAVICGVAATK